MDSELAMGLRNMLLCGAIVTSVSFVHELPELVVLPFRKFLFFFRHYSSIIGELLREKSTSEFWEIDMTKFEP